ncbi:MAG: potassium transporter Kup [Smithellaceae bacterium]|jgi:KUP system potassium uptake protein|nr:potassium transporter Kup [Syntrophaceae bacterium]MBP8608862.1 potassium transporter Kup [Syntrophaceae bacterium]MDX9817087.1 potassium transporter Kup [Smithellaceae bacterium]NMD05691.1 potassium transporter Kup [Deltaproteobacteria bacterium]HOM69010.1 potassium transporter Kup [Smithellaceae bacterium]
MPSSNSEKDSSNESKGEFPLPRFNKKIIFLAIASIGVVFGDIGTSPLYAIKACFHGKHAIVPSAMNILGVLSLIFWSITVVVSVKYLTFILRADNRGEGGIFALVSLLNTSEKKLSRFIQAVLLFAAILGAGLLYGDGVITPAISVLSAIEGLEVATKAATPFIVSLTCIVLVLLFSLQQKGTANIGKLFAPIMVLWFLSIGFFGLMQVTREPTVLLALNPVYALEFFMNNGMHGIVVLGSVVLCITGCEALYADLGHFGRNAIRLSWFSFVFPSLLCNYFGQGALLLAHPEMNINPFYKLVPESFLYPMIGLSTAATIIASQALISGTFSLTQQAVQLGLFPRVRIIHTSSDMQGQIYIPFVNYALMLACIGVVVGFKESSSLAGAYGIAVTGTMIITSLLFFLVLMHYRRWPLWKVIPLVGIFIAFDVAFFVGNTFKIIDGGWFPLFVAAIVALVMTTWKKGREELYRNLIDARLPIESFLADLPRSHIPRVSGTAVFMTLSPLGTPRTLLHNVKHNHVLHEQVVFLSIMAKDAPIVPAGERIKIQDLGQGFYRVEAFYGFMQKPNVPQIMKIVAQYGLITDPMTTTFYLGRETLMTSGKSKMMRWRKSLFAVMSRNAGNPTSYFGIPANRVVELGAQVEL